MLISPLLQLDKKISSFLFSGLRTIYLGIFSRTMVSSSAIFGPLLFSEVFELSLCEFELNFRFVLRVATLCLPTFEAGAMLLLGDIFILLD